MAAMRCERIAAWSDERSVGFGIGYSRLELPPGSGQCLSRPTACPWQPSGPGSARGQRACRAKPRTDLMPSFRLRYRLPDFCTAIGALIDEVDLRHAPMRLDVSDVHRE